jgi:hypothetical protein
MEDITTLDQWNNVTTTQFKQVGGGSFLSYFGGSLANILREVYPKEPWLPVHGHGYWKDVQNQRNFFENVREQLGLSIDDLYTTPKDTLMKAGAASFIVKYYNGNLKKGSEATFVSY